MIDQFQRVGRMMFAEGLISSHGGNMSVRVGDRILITRRGSMLGDLQADDVVETGLTRNDWGVTLASTELVVHRAIYQQTPALAVVHAHPVAAVVLSLTRDEIIPIDSEASYLLHKVPVVATELTAGSAEVARVIPAALQHYKIAMLRGHGSFATGQLLEEAYQWTSSLEVAARICYMAEGAPGGQIREYRKGADRYGAW